MSQSSQDSRYPRFGIPDFQPIYDRKQRGERLNPLEEFIFENEPAGTAEERDFCQELSAVIAFVRAPLVIALRQIRDDSYDQPTNLELDELIAQFQQQAPTLESKS